MIASRIFYLHFPAAVEGKRKGSGVGAGGARGKLLGGPIWFPLAPPALHLHFAFKKSADLSRNQKSGGPSGTPGEGTGGGLVLLRLDKALVPAWQSLGKCGGCALLKNCSVRSAFLDGMATCQHSNF
jgi:hypothetical protein